MIYQVMGCYQIFRLNLSCKVESRAGNGRLAVGLLGLLVTSCWSPPQSWEVPAIDKAPHFARQLATIVEGRDSPARAEAIVSQLKSIGIRCGKQHFHSMHGAGMNVFAYVPSGRTTKNTIILGAHYDKVTASQGAVDNASSCALLLQLLKVINAQPLNNHALTVAFFDQEELGLQGSEAYIEECKSKTQLPALYLNFDVFAYGDTLWMYSSDTNSAIPIAMREAAKALSFRVRETEIYPPSDHLSFINAGVNSTALSLIDGEEIEAVVGVISGRELIVQPKVLTIIHSDRDTLREVDHAAVERAFPLIERMLRVLDLNASS